MTDQNQAQIAQYVAHQMAQPHSAQGIFELPCGYLTSEGEVLTEVKVNEITGVEEDMLAAKNIPGGKKITQLIANCMERLGNVVDRSVLVGMARDLPLGDRVFLMLAIRRVTLGDDFPFEHECPNCQYKDLQVVNLGELAIKPMPDPKKRVYDVSLPSGKPARFHVMTGKDEENLSKHGAADQLSLSILVRLDLLGGMPATLQSVKKLNMRDRNFLRDQFEEVEGGVETSFDYVCAKCGYEGKADLDVGQRGFFFPSRTQKASKTSTSSF